MEISGFFIYKNLMTMQHPNIKIVLDQLIKKLKPIRILEIGTSAGGLTLIINDLLDENNLSYSLIRTYDVNDPVYLRGEIGNNNKIDIRVKNIFNHVYNDIIDEDGIKEFLNVEGPCLILCDGGSKKNEFNIFSKFLKKGDVIMAHDYASTEKFFNEKIKNKIWNWHEISDEDIESSVKLVGLSPFMEEELQNVVWVAKIKN